MNSSFHAETIQTTIERLRSGMRGLSTEEAVLRLQEYGRNSLPKAKMDNLIVIFFRQFRSILVYIIIVAMAISFFIGHQNDAFFIVAVILVNAIVGTLQEYKAEKTLIFLRLSVDSYAHVIRNAGEEQINAAELVPGDIIMLHAGNKVPADARLVEMDGLEINESMLTGESMPVTKDHLNVYDELTPLADRKNMVFAGSFVDRGKATAIVTATGIVTEIGKIAQSLKKIEKPVTPLQKKIADSSRSIGIGILIVVAFLLVLGYLRGEPFADIFTTTLALAVSAVPEGLTIVITIILVVGMRRLLSQKALVKKLNVAETLGSTTVICTDKTGTLTHGDMRVCEVLTAAGNLSLESNEFNNKVDYNDRKSLAAAFKCALFTSDAFIENPHDEPEKWIIKGKPTERALLFAALQVGFDEKKIELDMPVVKSIPFSSTLKLSASLRRNTTGDATLYVVGAPEVIIAKSNSLDIDGKQESLQSEIFKEMQRKSDAYSQKGMRLLACAYRSCCIVEAKDNSISDFLKQLNFVGFIVIRDPVRAEAKEALQLTEQAGIRTVIITGDHKYTALAVAEELGMSITSREVLDGEDIERIGEEELIQYTKSIRLYARVAPDHKTRIVEALRSKGEVVAMVGDGVNDAPSLHGADIGVAVGSGSDIAKEASDMVILDDNFHTLVKAVEQGRIIFENIRKVIIYLLADDFSEIFVIVLAIILGLPLPLLPSQILFINLIEDTFPAAALVFSNEKKGLLMKQKPRGLNEPIFTRAYFKWLVAIFFIGGAALLSFFLVLSTSGDLDLARTFTFALTGIDSLAFALVVSSLREPLLRRDIFSNHYLIAALFFGIIMIIAAVYLPLLQDMLKTVSLKPMHWLEIAGISVVELALLEITKYWFLIKSNE